MTRGSEIRKDGSWRYDDIPRKTRGIEDHDRAFDEIANSAVAMPGSMAFARTNSLLVGPAQGIATRDGRDGSGDSGSGDDDNRQREQQRQQRMQRQRRCSANDGVSDSSRGYNVTAAEG